LKILIRMGLNHMNMRMRIKLSCGIASLAAT
jgi:hypothetical protein